MNNQITIQKDGVVFTPKNLANFIAEKTLRYVSKEKFQMKKNMITVVDPACGNGQLLESFIEISDKKYKNKIGIYGLDINKNSILYCKKKFLQYNKKFKFVNTNALSPFNQKIFHDGWLKLQENLGNIGKFDIMIANPPWGSNMSTYKEEIDKNEFETLENHNDSFEIFLELALKIVKPGGYFSFIIPDSILNHGENIIRKKLISSTEIKYIGRLGEKIFPDINRACVIIIVKNSAPAENSQIDCFRLLSKERRNVLSGKKAFEDVEKGKIHAVLQKRFLKNSYQQIDIDLRQNEQPILKKLYSSNEKISDYLVSTRGVELGISGEVCLCQKCQSWIPLPVKQSVICEHCKNKIIIKKSKVETIIIDKEDEKKNSKPLITGKDLKRYKSKPTHNIILNKKGINYKPKDTYLPPKILIRKTGIGITATIDYSSSYVTQVVYVFKTKPGIDIDLEFFIALLNSRIYYFILAKSYGELEWRSHPYLTQSQIGDIPIPILKNNKKIINEIISLMKSYKEKGALTNEVDLKIELLIGKLFKLTKNDFKVIMNLINESDELLPVKHLKNINLEDILKRFR
tara:strand:- start:7488 stop:9209 length:1722 start_codon:yes stop_codon:yes gene_type:complete